jgi:Na+-translocating ferredoxin:NAD+ oxidoreductase RnfD subunit
MKNIKHQIILMLVILAVAGSVENQDLKAPAHILFAVSVALLVDFIGIYIRERKKVFSESAVITGLIISLLISPDSKWFIPVTAAFAAIAIKHILRWKGKHIFNPAASGLLVSFLFFKDSMSWWGGMNFWMILLMGIPMMFYLKRLPLVGAYLVPQALILTVIYSILHNNFINVLFFVNYFFAFIMLVEPKTSPLFPWSRIIFGAFIGIVPILFQILLFRWVDLLFDPSLIGLLVANMFVPLMNKFLRK